MTTTVLELNVSGMICRACEDAIADALLHTRGMADVIAADLSRMAPLHQLMRQMRPGGTGRTGSGARAGSEGARRRAGRCGEARKAGCSFRRRV